MKVIDAFLGRIKRYANVKYIVIILAVLIAILIFMERGPFGFKKLKEMSGGIGTLEMRFNYSGAEAYGLLDKLGSSGRNMYIRLLVLDYLFIVVFMVLQMLLNVWLVTKAKLNFSWNKLNLLSFVRSALDFAENLLLLILIAYYPVKLEAAVLVASVVTIAKLITSYGYMAIAFFLGSLAARRNMILKSNGQK